jgi:hypothetical protein
VNNLAAFLSSHAAVDIAYYLLFFLGQMLFLLKRAGSAIRNSNTAIHTRRDYFYNNWDVILIRAVIELVVIYWPLRHFTIEQVLAVFNINWDSPLLNTALNSSVGFFVCGYAADSLLDWLSVSPKLPQFLRDWIHENVPVQNGTPKQ